ncbi:interleukin-12 receptor subunit beta-2-like isoform X2 [Lissotriton helveticus]
MDCAPKVQWIAFNVMTMLLITKAATDVFSSCPRCFLPPYISTSSPVVHGCPHVDRCGDVLVTASTSVAPVGSSITISCSTNQLKTCRSITINNRHGIPQSTICEDWNAKTINASNLTVGKITFTCSLDCGNTRNICGIYIDVGSPPDKPRNVSCNQYGEHGNITFTWEAGVDPYISTQYSLQLENGTHRWILNASQKDRHTFDSQFLSINLNRETKYTTIVNASNNLGKTSSLPLEFTFFDIVIPRPPNKVLIECQNSTAKNCTVKWQDDQDTHHFQLRYRPIRNSSWNKVEVCNTKVHHLSSLMPYTEYVFQVSSKFFASKGKWSEWSMPVIKKTPEAVPTGRLDVWYKVKEMFNKSHKITLLWKKMSLWEAKGEILHYEVTFQKHTSTTTQTWFELVIDSAVATIAVSACNAKGKSPPTHINISTFPENVQPNTCYYIDVYTVSENKAGTASSASGFSIEMAPVIGPEMYFKLGTKNSVLISWKEIPAKKQMGCIIYYSIYLQHQHINTTTRRFVIPNDNFPNQYKIKNLEAGLTYRAWMTATTEKGESTKGNDQLFFISIESVSDDSLGITAAVTLTVAVALLCLCMFQAGRNRILLLLSTILPSWCSISVPDPANSTWAKEHQSAKDKIRTLSNQLSSGSSTYEEPETVEVEEIFIDEEPTISRDPFIPSSHECEDPCLKRVDRISDVWQADDVHREQRAATTKDDGGVYKCQGPPCYNAMVVNVPILTEPFPDYSMNHVVDMTVSYLPPHVFPDSISCVEDSRDSEPEPFPDNTFSTPLFSSFDGILTLDVVKIDCNSFAQ